MPGGKKFADFRELKDCIATYEDEFARGLVESLITYGLGRPFGFTDEPLAEAILAAGTPQDYQIKTLIQELVQSETFRSR